MLVLLLGFDLQVSLPLYKYCLSKPSAHEIETTPSKCVTHWKELSASSSNASPHPGKVYILHPQRTADSQMPLSFRGWGGGVLKLQKYVLFN